MPKFHQTRHAFCHLVECGRAQFLHKHEHTNASIRRAGFPEDIFEVFLHCFGRGITTMRCPITIIEKGKKVKTKKIYQPGHDAMWMLMDGRMMIQSQKTAAIVCVVEVWGGGGQSVILLVICRFSFRLCACICVRVRVRACVRARVSKESESRKCERRKAV